MTSTGALRYLDRFSRLYRNAKVRLGVNVGIGIMAAAFLALAARHIAGTGWPLAAADPVLAAGAGLLFLLGYGLKAFGWQRLFAHHERPHSAALATAGAAASVTGLALPGRFDDAVRIAVVRKTGCRAGVRALAFSLFLLGLVDAVALVPLATTGASITDSTALRVGLAIVAAAGVAAAAILVSMPRLSRSARLARYRVVRWLNQRTACRRDAAKASVWVMASWIVRTVALALLLGAVGIGVSFPLAILFLTAAAASSALPVAPAGAATQVGAGGAILVASGTSTSQAFAFAMSAQLLIVFAGASILAAGILWHARRRLPRPQLSRRLI
jgi:Lysylphosphatidylglycerol synthase TM region